MKLKKNNLGMKYQDKYGLAGTKSSDYVIDENGNIVFDKLGKLPVKKINSYLTTDLNIKLDKCVMCGSKTEYTKEVHIDFREHYVEDAGQMCKPCHTQIY